MTLSPRLFLPTLLVGATVLGAALTLAVPATAVAQDDPETTSEDDPDAEETEEEKKAREEAEKKRLQEADDLDLIDDESELDQIETPATDDEEPDEDLLGDGTKDEIDQEGQDNSKIYREAAEDFSELASDEEMLAWDRYMRQYPKTLYKDRIERRLDDLEEQLYLERKEGPDDTRLDADQREVPISQGLLIENINPRTKVLTGFEWGLPDYINLMLDYEHGVSRNFSVHGGLRNRWQTWNFEFGARYALIKSSRTRTLVTGIADFRFAMDPAYLAFRPQVAFGKMIGIVDVQAQGGADIELRRHEDGAGKAWAPIRLIAGANVTVRADERVGIFLETNYNARAFTWAEGSTFRFPVGTFGLKLYPSIAGQEDGFMEINVGASVPYATRYYRWHDGSVMVQLNIYL